MKDKRAASFVIIFFLTAFLVSFGLTVAARSVATFSAPQEEKRKELENRIRELEKRRGELKAEIDELRSRLDELEKSAAKSDVRLKELQEQVSSLRFAAGLTPVKGPGVEIVLADAENPQLEQAEQAIVHDSDIRAIVNALLASGAEAIEINGERYTGFSCIRCVGPTVLVNSRRISSPFTIKAIGDPDSLERGLLADEEAGVLITEIFPAFGIVYRLTPKEELEIVSYKGSYLFSYAKEDEGEKK